MSSSDQNRGNAVASQPGELVILAEHRRKRGAQRQQTPLPKFDIQSFAGCDRDDLDEGKRPPRSAKLVASVSWSWSPAHSRSNTYWLCTDRKRSAWYLWEEGLDLDEYKKQFTIIAHGTPYRGILAKDAAERLLLAIWKEEWDVLQSPGRGTYVTRSGLLDSAEIARLEELAFPDDDV
jgi:hypothetical protein